MPLETPIQCNRRRFAEYRALALSRGLTARQFSLAECEYAGWEASDNGRTVADPWDHVNGALAVANAARLLPGTVAPAIARAMRGAA